MAYDKEEIHKQAKREIVKHKLLFAEDVIAYLPIASSTFYEWKMGESEILKDLLNLNKVELKVSMRSKWYKSDNATLQMGLMKLIGTDDEAHRLNGSSKKVEHSGNQTVVWKEEKTYEADKKTD